MYIKLNYQKKEGEIKILSEKQKLKQVTNRPWLETIKSRECVSNGKEISPERGETQAGTVREKTDKHGKT